MNTAVKKLIDVAIPLEAINEEGARRKRKAPAGYPTTLHKWWAQRPVAAARGILFAQMVDDPSSRPDLFRTERQQAKERARLFRILEDLVLWENTNNQRVLAAAREEIWESWRRSCAENADHPKARQLFDRNRLPGFLDPFAGGGTLPAEARRLGLAAFASDLNPVAVLINKAMIEIPSRFAGTTPVNSEALGEPSLVERSWKGADGLANDLRYYGQWIATEAEKRIGHLYPRVKIASEMALDRGDLERYVGQELEVIAWIWARTVRSPNPAFADVPVPLASTFMLSTRKGGEAYVEPIVEAGGYRFVVRSGRPKDRAAADAGTKLGRGANFRCIMSGAPMDGEHIKAEGQAGRMGARLMAAVLDGGRGRVYVSPTEAMERVAASAAPEWRPDTPLPDDPRNFWTVQYGLASYGDLFTDRQLVALNTLSELLAEACEVAERDAVKAGMGAEAVLLRDGGSGARAYSEALLVYLSMALSRAVDYGSAIATWRPKDSAMRSALAKQAIPMAWDFAEANPFGRSSSGFSACVEVVAKAVAELPTDGGDGQAIQSDAAQRTGSADVLSVISTDPPYYDNVEYADLSDFFYVWLRRNLRDVFPEVFSTVAVPKAQELVANPYRHGGKESAEQFFLGGMSEVLARLAAEAHPGYPVTIYYAFKQAETRTAEGTASTGWETFLNAVIGAGFAVSGTWPVRTEGDNRQVGIGANALASSIVLVCRRRPSDAPTVFRREFRSALADELPVAVAHLQDGNIAPVDLAQAAIGPGMAVFTRYKEVRDLEGNTLSVRDALTLINEVLDECLAHQEADFDADTRWALAWYEQQGFASGPFGVADTLSKAKNTSVSGLVEAGVLWSKDGKVRLLAPSDLPKGWDPDLDGRLTVWEVVHHLIRMLREDGEAGAAGLVQRLGGRAEVARELAYRLYSIAERKKRTQDALGYNELVQSWPEIARLARDEGSDARGGQTGLFDSDED